MLGSDNSRKTAPVNWHSLSGKLTFVMFGCFDSFGLDLVTLK